MKEQELYKLRFPIGEFHKPENISSKLIEDWIMEIELFPKRLKKVVEILSSEQLNYKYRPEGWAIKQVVHHCADSHMNSLLRIKLALTEDVPAIRPYYEDRFAELPDSLDENLEDSLILLKGLHAKLVKVMKTLSVSELKKEYMHPEHGTKFCLDEVIGSYAWHSNHHLAHIKQALELKY